MRADITQLESMLAAARTAIKEYEDIKAWHNSLQADINRSCGIGGRIPNPLDLAFRDDSPMDMAMSQLGQLATAIEGNQ